MALDQWQARCLDDSCPDHEICQRWLERDSALVVYQSHNVNGKCGAFIVDKEAQLSMLDEMTRLGQEMGDYD